VLKGKPFQAKRLLHTDHSSLVADSYLNTPEGKQEAEKAKREGSKFYNQSREVILRPGVFGGLAGACTYLHFMQAELTAI